MKNASEIHIDTAINATIEVAATKKAARMLSRETCWRNVPALDPMDGRRRRCGGHRRVEIVDEKNGAEVLIATFCEACGERDQLHIEMNPELMMLVTARRALGGQT